MKPRKKEKRRSSLKVSPTALKNKKKKLLARWTDGLFYFVKVIKVSESNKTCSVEFEDKSTAQVHFKDLLEAHDDGDAECHFCGDPDPASSNGLVTCSNCERVYHQYCHMPQVSDDDMCEKFVCRICVFASCAQTGGAKTTGHLAEKFAAMKQSLPYELKCLTWDATHTSNVEQLFCYCGGPGCWYNKMLQCCRCKQWFHEACLQCLKEQLLVGDHFYVFACAHCNHGKEFLHRMEMKWLDLTYVSLFHLTMTMGTRYVDVEDIVTCIMNHSSSFRLKEILNGHHSNWDAVEEQVLAVLRCNKSIFVCAGELRKKNTLYGIRERMPRAPQSFYVPGPGEKVSKESLLQASFSNKRMTFTPSKFSSPVSYVCKGTKKSLQPSTGARVRESKMVKVARLKSEHNYCTPLKCPDRRGACRSGSPSSTNSSSSGSSSFDLTDLGLYDTNNNSSPKQLPPPLSCRSVSPALSSSPEASKSHIYEREGGEMERTAEARKVKEGVREISRSESSVGETKQDSNGREKVDGRSISKGKTRCFFDSLSNDCKVITPGSDSERISKFPRLEDNKFAGGERTHDRPFWSLDTAFPQPVSFSGADNPFLTEFEQENLRQKRKHFEQELERLASALAAREAHPDSVSFMSKQLSQSLAYLPLPPGLGKLTGFKGELDTVLKSTQPSVFPSSKSASSNSNLTHLGSVSHESLSTQTVRGTKAAPRINDDGDSATNSTNISNNVGVSITNPISSTPTLSSPPEHLIINGVVISQDLLTHHSPKNGINSPTNHKLSQSGITPPLNSNNGRSSRLQRGGYWMEDRKKSSSPTVAAKRGIKEDDMATSKRVTALMRCLKNLTPTCGFHFPVLDKGHPAVTDTSFLVGTGNTTASSNWSKVNGNTSGELHDSSGSASSLSPQQYSLHLKPENGSRLRSFDSKRGFKRQHIEDSEDLDMSSSKKDRSIGHENQENVRRSHRSRAVVDRFQATIGGRGLTSSTSNHHVIDYSLADQYNIISLRVGHTGKVEYLIDWSQ